MAGKRSLAAAKAHFAECVREAEQGRPVLITRHGRPVAAIVAAEDLAQIERLRAAGPQGGLASVAGGWPRAEDLVEAVQRIRRTPPRRRRFG